MYKFINLERDRGLYWIIICKFEKDLCLVCILWAECPIQDYLLQLPHVFGEALKNDRCGSNQRPIVCLHIPQATL